MAESSNPRPYLRAAGIGATLAGGTRVRSASSLTVTNRAPRLLVRNAFAKTFMTIASGKWQLAGLLVLAMAVLGIDQVVDSVQKMLIYHPLKYDVVHKKESVHMGAALTRYGYELREVDYSIMSGMLFFQRPLHQRAFLVVPSGQTTLEALWIVYGGNAMVSIDWFPFVIDVMEHSVSASSGASSSKKAFLLMDYPGYGFNDGSPSSSSTLEAAEAAVKSALQSLGPNKVQELRYLGHSLGGAAVTQLAADLAERRPAWLGETRPVGRMVLSATFTSIPGMGNVIFGQLPGAGAVIAVLGKVSRHRWDNEEGLRKLMKATKDDKPIITFVHGRADEIVPVSLGRSLYNLCAQEGFESCCFIESKTSQHNNILQRELRTYLDLICADEASARSAATSAL